MQKGTEARHSFSDVLDDLARDHLSPSLGGWLEYLRARGSEAHHEVRLMNRQDALATVGFAEALLRFVYELPNRVPLLPALDDGLADDAGRPARLGSPDLAWGVL